MQYPGKLVLVVGISGSGKGALMDAARRAFPDIVFPVSCTTRVIRPGEIEGENYHFLTNGEFDAAIAAGEFLEWASYGGNRYGTLKEEIIPALEAGKLVLREVEIQGVRHIREYFPKETVHIVYVHAGSWETLKNRILARAPMSEEELAKRKERYEEELAFKDEADVVIENPDGALDDAVRVFIETLTPLHADA